MPTHFHEKNNFWTFIKIRDHGRHDMALFSLISLTTVIKLTLNFKTLNQTNTGTKFSIFSYYSYFSFLSKYSAGLEKGPRNPRIVVNYETKRHLFLSVSSQQFSGCHIICKDRRNQGRYNILCIPRIVSRHT